MLSNLSPRSIIQLLLSAVFGRMSTALSQIVAAIYLEPQDFGVYAAAVAITTVTTGLRAGGTGNYIPTMTPQEFESEAGRYFRYAMMFTAIGTVATLACTPIAARWYSTTNQYSERALIAATLAVGLNYVVYNLNVFPRARMITHLRLGEISLLDTVTGAVKLFGTWILATQHAGALALAGSILLAQFVEVAWTWTRSGLRPSNLRVDGPWLRRTFNEMNLPFVMGIMISLNSQTDTAVGSAFLPAAILGTYFFASQLSAQPAVLVGNSLRAVFTATTARVRGNADLESASVRTVFNGAMVFMPLVAMSLPAVFDPFERALWNGKWADAYFPVLILSATLIYPTALQLVSAPVAGLRDWRLAIRIDLVRAISKVVPAAVAGAAILWFEVGPKTSGIVLASAVGGAGAILCSIELMHILSRAKMHRASIVYELYSTPLAAILSAVAAGGLAHSTTEPLRITLGDRGAAAVECVLAGFLYLLLALILLRFGYTSTLERLIEALPEFMRPKVRTLFLL